MLSEKIQQNFFEKERWNVSQISSNQKTHDPCLNLGLGWVGLDFDLAQSKTKSKHGYECLFIFNRLWAHAGSPSCKFYSSSFFFSRLSVFRIIMHQCTVQKQVTLHTANHSVQTKFTRCTKTAMYTICPIQVQWSTCAAPLIHRTKTVQSTADWVIFQPIRIPWMKVVHQVTLK